MNFKDIENLTRRQLKTNLPAIMGEKNPTSHLEPRKQGVREKASADDWKGGCEPRILYPTKILSPCQMNEKS